MPMLFLIIAIPCHENTPVHILCFSVHVCVCVCIREREVGYGAHLSTITQASITSFPCSLEAQPDLHTIQSTNMSTVQSHWWQANTELLEKGRNNYINLYRYMY